MAKLLDPTIRNRRGVFGHKETDLEGFDVKAFVKENQSVIDYLKEYKSGPSMTYGDGISLIPLVRYKGRKPYEYRILCFNSEGFLVGERTMYIRYPRRGGVYVSGYIQVLDRAKGLSTPIELANMAMLEAIANSLKMSLSWKVTNRNLEDLAKIRLRLIGDTRSYIALILKTKEQQAWQRMYGSSGKLGFSSDMTKIIEPDGELTMEILRDMINLEIKEHASHFRPYFVKAKDSMLPMGDRKIKSLIRKYLKKSIAYAIENGNYPPSH